MQQKLDHLEANKKKLLPAKYLKIFCLITKHPAGDGLRHSFKYIAYLIFM
jgi:hypothetical protein